MSAVYGWDKSYCNQWCKCPLNGFFNRSELLHLWSFLVLFVFQKFFDYNEEDDFYSDVEEAGESVDESGVCKQVACEN